jgi:hypothetical protein
MKKLLLSLFVGLAATTNAQLTLTKAANEPIVGDQKGVVALDTTFYSAGLPNLTGTGKLWDFSNLAVNSTVGVVSTDYIAAATATATPPAGATIAEDQNGSYTFYKSVSTPTTQFELLSIKLGTISLNFSNSALIAKWPISYGYNVVDNIAGTANFSLTAQFTGSVNSMADGTGTLMMPQGNTFTNVLRLKSIQTMTVTFLTSPIATVQQTTYQYFDAGDKFPILTINNTRTIFGSQVSDATTANGNKDYIAIGVKENQSDKASFNILPNPANTNVSIELEKNKVANALVLINSIGQEVKRVSNTNSMAISEIPEGVYYLEVSSNGHTARKPLLIKH